MSVIQSYLRAAGYLSTLSVALVAFGAGCSSNPAGAACPSIGPTTCPEDGGAIPSYDAQVAGIVESYCTPCHAPGGAEDSLLLVDYSGERGLKANYLEALGQVQACTMPNPPSAPLPDNDKVALVTWLVCGAPDN